MSKEPLGEVAAAYRHRRHWLRAGGGGEASKKDVITVEFEIYLCVSKRVDIKTQKDTVKKGMGEGRAGPNCQGVEEGHL